MQENQPLYRGPMEELLKEMILETVTKVDPSAAQEIRNSCPEKKVKPVIQFLALHYGSPLYTNQPEPLLGHLIKKMQQLIM